MELNTLYRGDCIKGMKSLLDESIDLIVTDPPYLMNYKGRGKNRFNKPIIGDTDRELIATYIRECYRVLKHNGACYMFCNQNRVDFFKTELEKAGFNVKNMIVWVKNIHTAGDLVAQYGKKYELLFYVNKGRCPLRNGRLTDVWEYPKVSGKNQLHQNQKPLELIKRCIEKSSDPGAIVFDGFIGSGTTAIACLDTDRRYIGYELDPEYFNMADKRITEHFISNFFNQN